ncbi:EAL domain-containing protein [Methylovorus menthalis]|uniref:EAL domain-containing protein n=1 Tax=Methylovorus menthalis TaxID=1002227 RepID=UPI001E6199E6|nr:EAL domain-containing protein [Methylovorus menthalis]MCB4812123.1 EAL domain-containing protein [Methylovorus menthalis]
MMKSNPPLEIIKSSRGAHIRKTLDGIITGWDQRAEDMFGYSSLEVIGQPFSALCTHDQQAMEKNRLSKLREARCIMHFETEQVHKNGSMLLILNTLTPLWDLLGNMIGASRVVHDLTENNRIRHALLLEQQRWHTTLSAVRDAVITTDHRGHIEFLNAAAEKLLGQALSHIGGQPLRDFISLVEGSLHLAIDEALEISMRENRTLDLPLRLLARHGHEHNIMSSTVTPIRPQDRQKAGTIIVLQHGQAVTTSHAELDPLTGIHNRSTLETRLQAALTSSHTQGEQHMFMYLDLDQFKIVNDTCGHAVGDTLLKQIVAIIRGCLSADALLARLGGDEFAILLLCCDSDAAGKIADDICSRIEAFRFAHEQKRFHVSASIGLVRIDHQWQDISALLQIANAACYTAKQEGRNRTHLYRDTDFAIKKHHEEIQWVNRLELALEENRFSLYCQRILPLTENSGIHGEILLRLPDGNGAMIPAGAFMPAAERFHITSRIDRWVTKRVLHWLVEHEHAIDHIDVLSVNLSGQSIGDRAFHDYMLELIISTPATYSKLCFEITETAAITNLADANSFIASMRRFGIRFSLDDFGSGVSSFGHLKNLDVDYLKIDGQFIRAIDSNVIDQAMVRCICEIANGTGLRTIAEYVETVEVENLLRSMGIHYTQGYLRHKPAPLDEMLKP